MRADRRQVARRTLARTANSSPPSRATRSSSRTARVSRPATRRSSSSPIPWPSVSLTALKRSRSSMRSAKLSSPLLGRRKRPARVSVKCSRLARPVSGVLVREPHHPGVVAQPFALVAHRDDSVPPLPDGDPVAEDPNRDPSRLRACEMGIRLPRGRDLVDREPREKGAYGLADRLLARAAQDAFEAAVHPQDGFALADQQAVGRDVGQVAQGTAPRRRAAADPWRGPGRPRAPGRRRSRAGPPRR